MQKPILFFLLFLMFSTIAKSQENPTWQTPMHEVKFMSNGSAEAILRVDPSLRYADLTRDQRTFRLLFIYDPGHIKHAKILDLNTNFQVARGRGSYFWGNARFEFADGEIFKVKIKRNKMGHEVIGPYGLLFAIENHGIKPVKTVNEKDFLIQAFYVFARIKSTQKPPTEIIFIPTL